MEDMKKKKSVTKDNVDEEPSSTVSNNNNNNPIIESSAEQNEPQSSVPRNKSKTNNRIQVNKEVPRPFKCPDCDAQFAKKFNMQQHQRRHTGERPYKCSQCPKSFYRNEYLKDHEKYHVQDRNYDCDQCDDKFITKRDLNKHKSTHHPSDPSPFECFVCQKSFELEGLLNTHIRVAHGKKFECTHCQVSFSTHYNLRKHFKTTKHQSRVQLDDGSLDETKKEKKKMNTKRAKKKVLDKSSEETTQDEFNSLQCRVCLKSYKYQKNLEKHEILKNHHHHQQEQQQQQRNLRASRRNLRRSSELSMELDDPDSTEIHECPVCPRAFATIDGLGKHITCHEGFF